MLKEILRTDMHECVDVDVMERLFDCLAAGQRVATHSVVRRRHLVQSGSRRPNPVSDVVAATIK